MSKATAAALVTGGAKRIGKAIVEDLASHGFAVAIHANRSGDEAADGVHVGQVSPNHRGAAARPIDLRGQGIRLVVRAIGVDGDGKAMAGEVLDNCLADPFRPARHQGRGSGFAHLLSILNFGPKTRRRRNMALHALIGIRTWGCIVAKRPVRHANSSWSRKRRNAI